MLINYAVSKINPMCTVIFHTLNNSLAILLFFQVDRMSGSVFRSLSVGDFFFESLNDDDHSSISLWIALYFLRTST